MKIKSVKKYFKAGFRIFLAFQLYFTSSPVYAHSENEESDESLFLFDMNTHINEGTIDDFLNKHREKLSKNQENYKQRFDYFRLSGQVVHLISHAVKKTEEGPKVTEQIRDRIDMDTSDVHLFSKPIRRMSLHQPAPEQASENFQYPEQKEGWAFLEGVSNQRVQVRHYFPDFNIRAKAENDLFTAFLDSKKGLVLIYKPYAQTYIGKAPIPVIQLSPEVHPNSPPAWPKEKKEQLSLEFINSQNFKPFDSISGRAFFEEDPSSQSNFTGRRRFSEGGLALVRTNSEGRRHLIKYAGQRYMLDRISYAYKTVALMVTAENSADHLNSLEASQEFKNKIDDFLKQGKEFLSLNISSVLLRQSIHRLAAVYSGIQFVINTCQTTHCRMFVEPEKQDIQKRAGQIRKTAEALSRIQERFKNFGNKTLKAAKHPLTLSTGILVLINFLWPSLLPAFFEKSISGISNIAQNSVDMSQNNWNYFDTLFKHVLTAGVVVFAGLWLFGGVLHKGPQTAVQMLSSNRRTKQLKLTAYLQDIAERIEKDQKTHGRFVMPIRMLIKLSMKFNALFLQPFYVYIMKYVLGQPVFIHAYKQGLHPGAAVYDEESERRLRLGWMRPTWLNRIRPSWGSSPKEVEERYRLQHKEAEKQRRIRNTAFILAVMAVSDSAKEASDFRVGAYSIKNDLERIYRDPDLQKKHDWIFVLLSKDMMSEIDMIDLSKVADIQKSIWDTYYLRAKRYAREYSPSKGAGLRKWLAKEPLFQFWTSVFTVNSELVRLFESQPSEFIESRVIKEIVTDQATVLLFPFLAGERNESFYLEKGHIAAGDASGPLHGSGAHSNEAMQNLGIQVTANVGMNVLVWGEETKRIAEFAEEASQEHQPKLDEIKTHRQSWMDYIKRAKRAHPELELFSLAYQRESAIAVKMFQFWIVFMVLTRTFMADQSLGTAFLASLIFIAARPWIYSWVWTPVQLFAGKNSDFIQQNKKKMQTLQTNFLDIYNKNFEDEFEFRSAYKENVQELIELYRKKPQLFQYLQHRFMEEAGEDTSLEQMLQSGPDNVVLLENESIKDIERNSRILSRILAEKPPLPNKESTIDWHQTFWIGAVGSTILFIEFLSIPTYDNNMVNFTNLLGAGGIFAAYMMIAKKAGEWRMNSQARQIKAGVLPTAPPKSEAFLNRVRKSPAVQKTADACIRLFQKIKN